MRVAVYDAFWNTAGGGEKYAGGIAEVLAADHRVDLLTHEAVDLDTLGDRLQLRLGAIGQRMVARTPGAVTDASAGYDLFVNASYGSVDACAAERGVYVVHFPVMPPFRPGRLRRSAISATARLSGRHRAAGPSGAPPAAASSPAGPPAPGPLWRRGTYAPEQVGPLVVRWTDGDAEVELPSSARDRPVSVILARLLPPGAPATTVEAAGEAGEVLGRVVLTPRTRPWEAPVRRLRFRAPGASGPLRVRLRSGTIVPGDGDRRTLGVPVVAVLVGGPARRVAQAADSALATPAVDLSFLDGYQRVVANSAFTAGWIERLWGREAPVLHPPVTAQPRGEKGRAILHVGRFFPPGAGHSKRQLDLVGAFRTLVATCPEAQGWELHLAGGCDAAGEAYLDEVRAAGAGLAVHVHPNAPAPALRDLYATAAIYWHATGLGEDPDVHPDRFEHFGISTVEAMSAGCVPVAIAAAGQLEVFNDGVEGYHFATVAELVDRTAALIGDVELRDRFGHAAVARAARYGWEPFVARCRSLLT